MFDAVINTNKIPPNFLNSILTNPSLYDMFKNEFDENSLYFQNISKNEYLQLMLRFIEDTLFSSNIFHIYSEVSDIDLVTKGKLNFIKQFYDDFLLIELNKNPENILNTSFFKGLVYSLKNDSYAAKTKEFNDLYNYVFNESIDYTGIVEVLLGEAFQCLKEKKSLSIHDFDLVCNYVKNNIENSLDMDLITGLLHNHAYKTNHIFDPLVVEKIVSALIDDYTAQYGIKLKVEFPNGTEDDLEIDDSTVLIDYKYIEGFVSLNYVELFENVFFEVNTKVSEILLKENKCDYLTFKNLISLLVCKVDLNKIYTNKDYMPSAFLAEAHAASFVASLKFFSSFGVNLFESYIESKTKSLDFDVQAITSSHKEFSLDQRFNAFFEKCTYKKELLSKYPALNVIYNENGRLRLIDLVKKASKNQNKDFIVEYLHSRIIEPLDMIIDVNDLATYNTRNLETKELIENQLKFIYVDTFYYSLNSYIKMHSNKLNVEEYLDDLIVKVNCIKDTPLTHKFIDECLFTINDLKEN